MDPPSTSSAILASMQLKQGKQGNSKELDQQVVKDLIQHFFANPPIPSSFSTLSQISPQLTISLPYLPISPPTCDQINSNTSANLQKSTSAKSLAIFHLPILAVNTLPRSNWSLSITDISPSYTDTTSSLLALLDPRLAEGNSIEVWTADLQWTLRFGSINTTTTGVDGINPSLAYQAGNGNENYDDWVSIGDQRKVELVFMWKKIAVEGKKDGGVSEERSEKKKGEKGKDVVRDVEMGNEQDQFQLIHLRLSLPPGSSTPASLPHRSVPTSLQPILQSVVSKAITPISLFFAFQFLQYFHLDQGSPRLKLPSPSPPSSTSPRKKSRSRSRSRSRTPRPLRPTSLFPTSTSSPTISSSIPSVLSTLHVEIPSTLPTPDELDALKSIRCHPNPPLPSPRIIDSLDSLSRAQQQQVPVISVKSVFGLVWAVLSVIVSEVGELYYLIARFVVLFTEVVMAMGEVFKDGVKTKRRRFRGSAGLSPAVGVESPIPSPSHPSSSTLRPPSLHSHSHLSNSSKRVSFPTLSSHFATIIGYTSSPGTSTPSSPTAPPPSLVDERVESPVKLRFEEREIRKLEKREESGTSEGGGIEVIEAEAGSGKTEDQVEVESSVPQALSASEYPTPASRLSSLPSPSTETFEPPSPSNSSSSSIGPVPLESPNLPLSVQPEGDEEEKEESAPTSPEISRGGFELRGKKEGEIVDTSSALKLGDSGNQVGEKVEEKRGESEGREEKKETRKSSGAKGRKRKGRK